MNLKQTLGKSARMIWKHKLLWLLGFFTSLGADYGGLDFPFSPMIASDELPSMSAPGSAPGWLGAAIILGIVLLALVALCMLVIGLIARAGLIASVQRIETDGKTTFSGAFKIGISRFWRMLGMRIVVYLPVILVTAVGVLVLLGALLTGFGPGFGQSTGRRLPESFSAAMAVLAPVVVALGCATSLYNLAAMGLEVLAERAIVIDELPVRASLSKAWLMFKAYLGDILVVAAVLFAISLGYGFVCALGVGAIIAPIIVGAVAAFESQATALGVGLMIVVLAIVLTGLFLLGSLFTTYVSTVWTLTYRQLSTLHRPVVQTPAVPHAPMPA